MSDSKGKEKAGESEASGAKSGSICENATRGEYNPDTKIKESTDRNPKLISVITDNNTIEIVRGLLNTFDNSIKSNGLETKVHYTRLLPDLLLYYFPFAYKRYPVPLIKAISNLKFIQVHEKAFDLILNANLVTSKFCVIDKELYDIQKNVQTYTETLIINDLTGIPDPFVDIPKKQYYTDSDDYIQHIIELCFYKTFVMAGYIYELYSNVSHFDIGDFIVRQLNFPLVDVKLSGGAQSYHSKYLKYKQKYILSKSHKK